jgi:WD40 repeat protein/energy-coupling factor transporter ATP-binding protein EcfA2
MTEPETTPYDLFVSYAQADRAWVEGYLLDALHAAGVAYHSEHAFALGAPRLTEFERAIQESARTLLVLSPAYLADEFAQFTDLLAQTYGLETATWPVLPLILEPVQLPPRLSALVALDATDPEGREVALACLLAELQRPVPEALPRPPCPYPGMVPFDEKDAQHFFGRENEIDALALKLRHQSLLFVIGPSGSGKSSLVRAGLVPRLHERQPGEWLIRTFRPAGSPLFSLCQTLGIPYAGQEHDWAQAVQIALAENAPVRRLLLIVDQFEELFVPGMEREPFLTAILELRQVQNCALVLAMRADFYPDLMTSSLWPVQPAQRVEIAPLRGDALREAIERPARDVGVYLEAGLPERLLADAATEPGVLPLVQETMQELWQRMERRLLPLSAYERLGSGGRSGLAVAVANKADATLLDLAPEEQTIARRTFLRLIQFGEGRPDTRRQQPLTALRAAGDDPAVFDRTLDYLTSNRLLTVSGEQGDPDRRVDLSHEALIDGWPTLRRWVDRRREAELVRRGLEAKADEWVQMGRGSGGLLDAVELGEAQRWLGTPDACELGRSEALLGLVAASQAQLRRTALFRWGALAAIVVLVVGVLAAILVGQAQLAQQRGQAAQTAEADRNTQATLAAESATRLVVAETAQAVAVEKEQLADTRAAQQVIARRTAEAEAIARSTAQAGEQKARATAEAEAEEARRQSRLHLAGSLAVLSSSYLDRQLDLALLLSAQAMVTADTFQVRDSLLDALQHSPFLVRLMHGHTGIVSSIAFSPDGKWLASGSADRTVRLWDVGAGQPLVQPLTDHTDVVLSVTYSPDGKYLASGSANRTVRLWDVRDPMSVRRIALPLTGHVVGVRSLAYSPSGETLASGSWDSIRLWDVGDPSSVQPLGQPISGYSLLMWSLSFSPDGKVLALGRNDGTIQLWDVGDNSLQRWPPLGQPLTGHGGTVTHLTFSLDGQTLVSGSEEDGTIRRWDVSSPLSVQPLGQPLTGTLGRLAFSPGGGTLASMREDGAVGLWDLSTGQSLGQSLTGHVDGVTCLAFSSDGKMLAAGSGDHTICLWEIGREQLLGQSLTGHADGVSGVVYSPDGRTLASGGGDKAIRLWNAATGQPLGQPLIGHADRVTSLAYSPDGKLLASGSLDGAIWVWDMGTGRPIGQPLTDGSGPVNSLAFSPDGKTLASRERSEAVRLWNVGTGRPIGQPLTGHVDGVHSMAYSPNSATVAIGCGDGTIRLWDVGDASSSARESGQPLAGHDSPVSSLAYSSDGEMLASGSDDGTIQLWDVSTGQPVGQPLIGHTWSVTGLAFSPDGETLASGSDDGTIRLWDVDTGQPLGQPLASDIGQVSSLAYSPDGKILASASMEDIEWPWDVVSEGQDGGVWLWDVDSSSWKERACGVANRNLTQAEWNQFVGSSVPYECTCPNLPPGEGAPVDACINTH